MHLDVELPRRADRNYLVPAAARELARELHLAPVFLDARILDGEVSRAERPRERVIGQVRGPGHVLRHADGWHRVRVPVDIDESALDPALVEAVLDGRLTVGLNCESIDARQENGCVIIGGFNDVALALAPSQDVELRVGDTPLPPAPKTLA